MVTLDEIVKRKEEIESGKTRCGKSRFASAKQAKEALKKINTSPQFESDIMPTTYYHCDGRNGCGGWHLTSYNKVVTRNMDYYKKNNRNFY